MKVEIIEVGTSDFRTLAGQVSGIFIEPVKEYFDRLPEYCNRVNCAISNYSGDMLMYYIPSEIIERENLPNWLRGCNSIDKVHPTILKMDLLRFVKKELVLVRTIKSIIEEFGVTAIDHLKIDTEGHDLIILNDFLDTCEIKPLIIQFEANELSDQSEQLKTVGRLKALGYDCKPSRSDYFCTLTDFN